MKISKGMALRAKLRDRVWTMERQYDMLWRLHMVVSGDEASDDLERVLWELGERIVLIRKALDK